VTTPPPLHTIPGSDITITSAGLFGSINGPNTWAIDVTITPPGGAPFPWTFIYPEDIVEKRCAEFGLDISSDSQDLLALVLYEAFVQGEASTTHPNALWNSTDTPTARQHYLTSVTAARGSGRVRHGPHPAHRGRARIVGAAVLIDTATHPEAPLDLLARELTPHPGRVAVFAEHVQSRLADHRNRRATGPSTTQLRRRPTPEELRRTLRSNTTQTSQ
jgi:hypothetical protein